MKFYKSMLFVMGGHLILVGTFAWLLTRFHGLESGSFTINTLRLLTVLPLECIFIAQLLGQIRNLSKGFVITSQGFVLVEFHVNEEPISFIVGLVWEFILWGGLAYVFFRLLGHLG